MDQDRFEAALKALHAGTTRRRGLAAALSAVLGAAAATVPSDGTAKRKKPSGCSPKTCANGCCDGKDCRPGTTDTACGAGGKPCRRCPDGMRCRGKRCIAASTGCSAATCPNGCCDATNCRPGSTSAACGANGRTCIACPLGQFCQGKQCKRTADSCTAESCPDGCCDGTVCLPGTSTSACGSGAARCAACPVGTTCQGQQCETQPCTATTCPDGCCDGTVCRNGSSTSACGTGGATCEACVGGATCQSQQCLAPTCSAATCPNGCCDGTVCLPGTSTSACGTGGAACVTCSGNTTCQAQQCQLQPCTATTCPNGCCDGTVCRSGSSTSACGAGGATCEACVGGATCQSQQCLAPTCSAATCPDGCCNGTVCRNGSSTSACGTGGAACATCPAGETCQSQQCLPETCSAANCANGCCDGTTCNAGTSAAACGTAGAACVVCSSSAPICDNGTCSAGTWAPSVQFGTFGEGDSYFEFPNDLYVSADTLTAWVADSGNNRIAIWTRPSTSSAAWNYSTQFGTAGSGTDNLFYPSGVFVSPDTLTAWVADSNNDRISIWTRPTTSSMTWSYSTQFGTRGSGNDNFNYPNDVYVSSDTLTAWVADYYNNRIAVWNRPTTSSTTWSYSAKFGTSGSGNSNLFEPNVVVVSADMLTAWVADTGNDRIAIWTRPDATSVNWSYSAQFGTSGSGDSNFDGPQGVFVSADTLTAWVADAFNNRIAIWTRPSSSSLTWSYSAQFGTGGTGSARFNDPTGVVVSADGLTAWVADYNNNRISIWTQS